MFNFKKIALLCGVIVIADAQATLSSPMPRIKAGLKAVGEGAVTAKNFTVNCIKHPVESTVAAKDACVAHPKATVGVVLCAAGVVAAIKFRKKIRNGFNNVRKFLFGKKS